MKELPSHLDELNEHIRNPNDEIGRFMKLEEREAAEKIQDAPGIAQTSAQAVIAVVGTDMGRFPTISSWAGLCPGKRRSGKTRKGAALLRSTLPACAHSAVKVKSSCLHAQYARIAAQNALIWRQPTPS